MRYLATDNFTRVLFLMQSQNLICKFQDRRTAIIKQGIFQGIALPIINPFVSLGFPIVSGACLFSMAP